MREERLSKAKSEFSGLGDSRYTFIAILMLANASFTLPLSERWIKLKVELVTWKGLLFERKEGSDDDFFEWFQGAFSRWVSNRL